MSPIPWGVRISQLIHFVGVITSHNAVSGQQSLLMAGIGFFRQLIQPSEITGPDAKDLYRHKPSGATRPNFKPALQLNRFSSIERLIIHWGGNFAFHSAGLIRLAPGDIKVNQISASEEGIFVFRSECAGKSLACR